MALRARIALGPRCALPPRRSPGPPPAAPRAGGGVIHLLGMAPPSAALSRGTRRDTQRDSSSTRALRRAGGSISLMARHPQTSAPARRAACRSGGSTPRLRHAPYLIRPDVVFAHRGARGGRGSWSGGARDLATKPQHPRGPNTRVNLREASVHSCSAKRSGTPACRSGAPCKRLERNGAPSRPERCPRRSSCYASTRANTTVMLSTPPRPLAISTRSSHASWRSLVSLTSFASSESSR